MQKVDNNYRNSFGTNLYMYRLCTCTNRGARPTKTVQTYCISPSLYKGVYILYRFGAEDLVPRCVEIGQRRREKMKKEREFCGRIPKKEQWRPLGVVTGEAGDYLVFLRISDNPAYTLAKVVLGPGLKARKANFWLSVKRDSGYIPRSSEYFKMADNYPMLTAAVERFLHMGAMQGDLT